MNKTISHYVARFDMPGYKKGQKAHQELCERFPDVFEPIYKEDPVIPPGVVKMYHDGIGCRYTTFGQGITHTYEQWYECFTAMGYKPFTISVNGTEWSVGDETNHFKITGFEWYRHTGMWRVRTTNHAQAYWIDDLAKLPTRTPICQLPDENGKRIDVFEGDRYWVVAGFDGWQVSFVIMQLGGSPYKHIFATLAAAEKYVFDNQPFYPRRDVELIMDFYEAIYGCTPAISNLKAFKETHLKEKV